LKLYDEAAIRIEALIQDDTFSPGTLLPSERELMKIFGVGRTSIREAIYALNRMGLIRLRNGERPLVTTPTPETLVLELAGAARYFLSQPDGRCIFRMRARSSRSESRERQQIAAPARTLSALEGHQHIFEAISNRNPEAAGEAMDKHLRSVAALIIEAKEDADYAAGHSC
jgi:GntR family transcriptional regulator, sialic acid-inducible nan operon repressor